MTNIYKPDYTIAGLGEILWDLLPEGKQLGGAPANFSYHCRVQGARSEVISAVGSDDLGKGILDSLKKIGLSCDFIFIDDEHVTGTVDVSLNSKGIPTFTIHENVAWDYIPFTDKIESIANRVDAVCFGTLAQRSAISQKTIKSFVHATPEKSLKVIDINLRQNYYNSAIINSCLRSANCLKLNDDELPVVAELLSLTGSEDKIVEQLIKEYDLILLALTKGAKGSRLIGLGEDSFLEAPNIQVVDTVGAGDAFTAAMVIGFLENYPIAVIHNRANFLSGYVCTQQGATPDITDEVLETLQNL